LAIQINSELHDKSVKSGDVQTPEAARVRVMWIVDRALARAAQTFRTKKSPVQSGGNTPNRALGRTCYRPEVRPDQDRQRKSQARRA